MNAKISSMHRPYLFILLIALCVPAIAVAAKPDAWIYGMWAMSYDPDGAVQDFLEFLPNGDAFSINHEGARIGGMYSVSEDRVTVVFSQNGRDVIATFFFDDQRQTLRIVTSKTGKETIYSKLPR